MHHSLGEQTFISWSTTSLSVVYLQPVTVGRHNACQVELSVAYLISTFDVEHQVSQDLENWTLPSTSNGAPPQPDERCLKDSDRWN